LHADLKRHTSTVDVEETGGCSSSDPGIQGESELKCISEKSCDSTSLYMRVSFVLSQSRESFDFWSRCRDFRNYLRTIYSVRFRLTRVRELASWSTFGNLYLVIPEAVYSYAAVLFSFQSEGA
jgi:hypothetical protein